jgi:uncharacterized repeat protein (TIGR04076 family)
MLSNCKITVLRRSLDRELIKEFRDPSYADTPPCENFTVGQEFLVDQHFGIPEGFCPWAWADIRHVILRVACGGDMPGMRHKGVEVAGCTDWFRPVLFKVERIEAREESNDS